MASSAWFKIGNLLLHVSPFTHQPFPSVDIELECSPNEQSECGKTKCCELHVGQIVQGKLKLVLLDTGSVKVILATGYLRRTR